MEFHLVNFIMNYAVFVILFVRLFQGGFQIKQQRHNRTDTSVICDVGYSYTRFNYSTQYCCKGNPSSIKPKTPGKQPCCSYVLPNGTKVTCCNKRQIFVASLKKAACCDSKLYNVELEFCHNEDIYSISPSTKKLYTSTQSFHSINQSRAIRGTNYTSLITVIFCTVLSFSIPATITTCLIIRKVRNCSSTYRLVSFYSSKEMGEMKRSNQNVHEALFDHLPTIHTLPESLETDGFENIEENGKKLLQKNSNNKGNFVINNWTDVGKARETVATNKCTQTESAKAINVRNAMGKEFDVLHVFDKNNKSLVLPHSAVKLTLSEEEVSGGQIECYASTYRSLKELYEVFEKFIGSNEEIVSPTVEYFFPKGKRLQNFASVDMDFHNCGCNKSLHVWRFESDIEHGTITHKEKIPNKKTAQIKNVDAFYEIISPSKLRIYLKRFCTLMCTVCHEEHESLSLTAHTYAATLPNNHATKHVCVTLYILAGVSQLPDYEHGLRQFVNVDEQHTISPPKKINLPRRVQSEDDLAIRLKLWPDSKDYWRKCAFVEDLDDHETVQLYNIVNCPRYCANGLPYFREWHFENDPSYIDQNQDKLILKVSISLSMEHPHPGVDTRSPPRTNFVITHEVDITDIKKHVQIPTLGGEIQPIALNSPHEDSTIQQHFRSIDTGSSPDGISRLPLISNPNTNAQTVANVYIENRVNARPNETHHKQSPAQYRARPKERLQNLRTDYTKRENRYDVQEANVDVVPRQIRKEDAQQPVDQGPQLATTVRAETHEESSEGY